MDFIWAFDYAAPFAYRTPQIFNDNRETDTRQRYVYILHTLFVINNCVYNFLVYVFD